MTSKRMPYWDNAKGLLICLVVLGHVLEKECNANLLYRMIHDIIYSFHMPLFIIISGYFSRNTDAGRATAFSRLFVPYFVFNTVAGILIERSIVINPFASYYGYWYLLSLFVWRLISADLKQMGKKALIASIALSLLSGLCPGNYFAGGDSPRFPITVFRNRFTTA